MIYKLKTLDVWDTLLRRDCHPECIKLATAMHLLLGWSDKLNPVYTDLWALYDSRLRVERSLAEAARVSGLDDEYEITKVVQVWLAEVLEKSADPSLSFQIVEFELNWEIKRSFVDLGIVDFVQSVEADRTIFLSDFYMSGDKLSRLLSAKGLSHLVHEGISSCDVGLNKRSGQLFHHVHALYGISPEQHFHVGDNSWSDVELPRQIGISAEHYLPTEAHAERVKREALFSSRSSLLEHILTEFAKNAESISQEMKNQEGVAFCIGGDAAPLFIGFALWIAENSLLKKLDKIYFLTREGNFFYKIYSSLFPDNSFFGHELPQASLLEVSRISTFAASMHEVSIEEMARVWSLFKVQSVSGLFTTLGLNINDFTALLDKFGLKSVDVISNPLDSLPLRRLFKEKLFIDAAQEAIDRQKELLKDYLRQNGVLQNKTVGIVDIGWRGTIQDNIAILIPDMNFHGMYLGLRQFINAQPKNTSKAAYAINENLSVDNLRLFENFALLEMLCVSSEGSVIGYEKCGNEVVAVRELAHAELLTFNNFTQHFQDGVIAASQHWGSYVKKYVIEAKELREASLRVWNALRRSPSQELTEAFINTPQHDLFGYGEMFHRNDFPSVATILLALVFKSKRHSLIEYIRRVQWIAPIKQAQEIGCIHRAMLVTLFRLANIMKRIRIRIRRLNRRIC